jgi:hypothetical protein
MLTLHIREIKDSDNPTPCTNDYFLSSESKTSVKPTGMWEPAHPPPGTVKRKAEYPPFAPIHIEGDGASIGFRYELCQTMAR